MSLASYTGNVLITGEEEETALSLAKALVREMQLNDSNFSGKVAKISSVLQLLAFLLHPSPFLQ